jgi:polyhydroxybutyrate depolymerase
MRPRLASVLLVAAALAIGGCSSSDDATGATTDDGGAPAPTQFGGSRPVTLRVPAGYDPSHPAPLVILLHGYSASGYVQDVIFHISSVADRYGYFFAAPDGTVDSKGFRFWNATDGCCDFDHSGVDDVAYLTGLVHDIEASYAIDAKRIYFVGHSNGGFMSHRLACDDASEIAAIVSVAGAVWSDASKCQPSAPVAVLEIHGDADQEVLYGGDPSAPYPSAMQTV